MAGVRFTELQCCPTEFLDFTSVTLDEFQQAARCLGGCRGDRGRTAGGGACAHSHWSRRRIGVPPFAHDGTD